MKNPFVKHNNSALIASIALGTAAAGAAAYLFMTEKGSGMRRQIMERMGFGGNEPEVEPPADYLKKPHKNAKTNREELVHHAIISEQPHLTN